MPQVDNCAMLQDATHIIQIALPVPLRRCFDYLPISDEIFDQYKTGVRVIVPFGRRKLVGIVVGVTDKSSVPIKQLKKVIEILDESPIISPALMTLCHFASEYYHHPLGDVLFSAIPTRLRQGKPETVKNFSISNENNKAKTSQEILAEPALKLNNEQQNALNNILENLNQFQIFLIEGITGSGKTEIYLQVIHACLLQNKQCLVLVPEIGLTPQTVSRFEKRFNVPIFVMHSGLNETQRLKNWLMAKHHQAHIIIGTRSAIFTPLLNPGAIIIDEEHDSSFKQQEGFRYSARDLAIMRGRIENIPVILGSATPSIETFHNANQQRYKLLKLSQRAGNAITPDYKLLDIRGEKLESGLSPRLLENMRKHLDDGNQVLLFLNRRGYAPVLTCHHCGWIAQCTRCDTNLIWHQSTKQLHCHYCTSIKPIFKKCPSCHSNQLIHLGMGTERLEETLAEQFPAHNTVRIDWDTTRRKGALQNLLESIHTGDSQILIGTQMLAKGHHFPNVTMVSMINADSGIFSCDFRASERMGQLLLQVAGRAGRENKRGEVVIQTRYANHPFWQNLFKDGYRDFCEKVLLERQTAILPPFAYLALFRAEAKTQQKSLEFLMEIKSLGEKLLTSASVRTLGPVPSPQEKRAGNYRAQLLLQADNRASLQNFLKKLLSVIEDKKLSNVRWSIDVDPIDLF